MLDLQGMVQEDLEDMVQDLVLGAVEQGEQSILISQSSQEVLQVVGFMGYHYEVSEEGILVRW